MPYWGRETTPTTYIESSPEECGLVVRAQGGNQAAFEALYERYNDRICRYVIRMVGDDGVGCELAQDVFAKAWEALPGLRQPEKFVGWLYRIATNYTNTYQQRGKRLRLISWDIYRGGAEELIAEGPEAQVEESELLKLALARVSPTYRPCLILYVIEELSQREIAHLLKIKEASVSKYVSRGKEELRQIYHQLAIGQSAGARGRGKKR
ncbi:RNA polymerase sigma factor [Reticulibacter mediterranei]|uniref:RNA polymerase sigma factor n=1 Tax=Reticulibacter mediterranei TaxID=2778369 RepID=A0A8J3IJG2_9CHLR|nr:RNA polymerase sigma factor [Reticulibacter mediterranei]GHO93583.1 RNA polymerase sigma factor [Reticulibacter mediterranei]